MTTLGTSTQLSGATKPSAIEADSYEKDLFAARITEIPTTLQMRAEYSSTDGLPDYVGYAPQGLGTGTDGWLLQKYTYDANRQCTLRQSAFDAWDNRSTTAVYS